MLFKEPGSFKQTKKLGGNIDKSKIYRLIPLSTPVIFRWTLPLTYEFRNVYYHNVIVRNVLASKCASRLKVLFSKRVCVLNVLVSKRNVHNVLKYPCSKRKNLQNVMYGTKRVSSKRSSFETYDFVLE